MAHEPELKLPFTALIVVAIFLTGISMFTHGWRYTEMANEGVIAGHYGDRLPWEKWVVAFMVAAFVLEIFTLIGALFGFYRVTTPALLYAMTLMTILPIIFLALSAIIYAINFNEPYEYTVTYNGRPLSQREIVAMYPFSRGAYREIALGYSYYLAPIAIIPLIIAAVLYLVPAIRRQKRSGNLRV